MELEKITRRAAGAPKRWYDDACGLALALELVGERWAPLVARELMFGPRRFGEIKAQLTGVSANVLTQRLEGLIASGIVQRRKLPSPASVQVYELTPWGYESRPIFEQMAIWALRSRRHDPTLPLSPASLMMSMRALFRADEAKGVTITAGFRFDDDGFVMRIADGAVTVERGDPARADLVWTGAPNTLIRVIYGKFPVDAVAATAPLQIDGDREVLARFVDLFALPRKVVDPAD